MALNLKDLVIAIATVTGANVTLSISTTVKVIEDSLIAAGQGDEDDSRWCPGSCRSGNGSFTSMGP
jgi:hypothetical protein